MAVTLGEFLGAERQQESGGNYRAVNSGSGALGAYQVMPANLPTWTRESLGHIDTPTQYLDSDHDQDAVAEHVLGGYFKKYGPRGAAAAWYSGRPDPDATYGNPPVYQYVDDVMALIGKAPSVDVSGSGSTSAASPTPPSSSSGGSTVQLAGLQQAGYEAAVSLTPWGLPLNPFKLPGWLAGKLGDAAGDAGKAAASGMWDAAGPVILASVGILTGAVLLVVGLYVTVKPTTQRAESLLPAAL